MAGTCALITTTNKRYSIPAIEVLKKYFTVVAVSENKWDDGGLKQQFISKLPADYLFSFLSPVVVPLQVLNMVKVAINIHPSPPKYRGVAGVSRALYNGDTEFGVTAHLMEREVDTGKILKVNRFPISNLTCETLADITKLYALGLLREIAENPNQTSDETWGSLMTRKQFKDWMEIKDGDDAERKILALRHPSQPGPFIKKFGHTFTLYD